MARDSKPLTAHQRAYAEARIEGLGPSAAYRLAYPNTKMSPQAIAVEAARLEKHPKVALVLAEAEAEANERLSITATMIAERAWEIAQQDKDRRSAVGALTLLAKRHPEFSEKHEVDARVGVMLVRQTRRLADGD